MAQIGILAKVESRVLGRVPEKERAVLVAFLSGLVGLFPSIVVILMSHSVTILSDLLKNVSLVFATFLSLMAVRRASRAVNANYNYGYGKLENLSSLMVGAMMIVAAAIIVFQTVGRIRNPILLETTGVSLGVVFAGLAAGFNGLMWRNDHRLARKSSSPVLESTWRLDRVKTVSGICVFGSLALSLAFHGKSWAVFIDPIGSFIILGFLLFSIYGVFSMSVYDLLDRTLEESLQLIILRELAQSFDKYVAIHGVRSRRSGSHVFIEIFLEFEAEDRMADVQKVIDSIRVDLEKKIPSSRVVVAPATASVS